MQAQKKPVYIHNMTELSEKLIWTVGHSTHALDEFVDMVRSFTIELIVDIRNYPGSRRYPHFNKESLEKHLPLKGINYIHIRELGGRRKPLKDSVNTTWKNSAFRGYADFMDSEEFKYGIQTLQATASMKRTAYMCSEAVWWSCHRSLVSDFLKINGWKVMHIMGISKQQEHPYTSAARIVNGKLSYRAEELF